MAREWLKEMRCKENTTQDEVAKRINMTRPAYSRIENGTRTPSVKTAKTLAAYFGFEWTRFFDDIQEDSVNHIV